MEIYYCVYIILKQKNIRECEMEKTYIITILSRKNTNQQEYAFYTFKNKKRRRKNLNILYVKLNGNDIL